MHSKQSQILFIGAFLIWLTAVVNAQCENKAVAPPCKLFAETDVVFIGRVTEAVFSEPDEFYSTSSSKVTQRKKNISFEIKESFKGTKEKQTEITLTVHQIQQRSQSGELAFVKYAREDCPYDEFTKDETYLVYAKNKSEEKEPPLIFAISATLVSEADNAITYLRNLKEGKQGAIVYGRVVRKLSRLGTPFGDLLERPIRNTKVELKSEKQIFTTSTDEKGSYFFSEIPQGEYSIKADLPERLEVESDIKKISLSSKSCTEKNIIALTNGRISGAVFNHEGESIKYLQLELVIASDIGKLKSRQFEVHLDEEGKFEFKNIPPEKYFLGFSLGKTCSPQINNRGSRTHSLPVYAYCQSRTYYPGVAEISQAIPINLSEGETVKDLDFRLLPPLSDRNISGIARTSDGHPIVNADIVLMVSRDELNESGGLTKTDEYGRFSIRAYNGLKYWLNANIKIKNEDEHSEPIELPLNGDVHGIKLIVSSSGKFCSLCYTKYWKRKGTPQQ